MHLLIGLGNIGKKYNRNRHNLGFLITDQLVQQYKFIKQSDKFNGNIFKGVIANNKIIILKPKTMMNNSGLSASKVKNYFKIDGQNIFVFYDDLDLSLAKVKIKFGGSSAGHNGIKSLDSYIGKKFHRVRIGINKPLNKSSISEYVLKDFEKNELEIIKLKINLISEHIELLLENKFSQFLNKLI